MAGYSHRPAGARRLREAIAVFDVDAHGPPMIQLLKRTDNPLPRNEVRHTPVPSGSRRGDPGKDGCGRVVGA